MTYIRENYRTINEALSESDLERFWSKVQIKSLDECWEWEAAKSNGYGRIYIQGSVFPAHRVSYFIAHGKMPENDLDHLCSNPSCVNPHHLEDVTHAENTQRWIKKQLGEFCKHGHPRTEENTSYSKRGYKVCLVCMRLRDKRRYEDKYEKEKAKATHSSEMRDFASQPKLNEELVMEILHKHYNEGCSGRSLAREYQVSQPMIRYILMGSSWNHVYKEFIKDRPLEDSLSPS